MRTHARKRPQKCARAHRTRKEVWPRTLQLPQRREMSYTKIPHFVFEGAVPRIIKWEPPLNVRGLATGRPKKTKTKHAVTNIEGRFPLYGDSALAHSVLLKYFFRSRYKFISRGRAKSRLWSALPPARYLHNLIFFVILFAWRLCDEAVSIGSPNK